MKYDVSYSAEQNVAKAVCGFVTAFEKLVGVLNVVGKSLDGVLLEAKLAIENDRKNGRR